ncbi:MAG TPA: hypothetical protein VIG24_11995 [Acidimicrobiia bacterium]
MSEENEMNDDAALKAADLETMKGTADRLGISYHPSIGAEKLSEKIKEFRAVQEENAPATQPATAAPEAEGETQAQRHRRVRQQATALVRIRVTCMNPSKKDIEGEVFTVSNAVVGTLKKYVPFNADEGWHVPQMILNMIRRRKCQVFVKEKTKNGVSFKKGKLINEFAVEVLPPLTEAELGQLAQRQAMASGA